MSPRLPKGLIESLWAQGLLGCGWCESCDRAEVAATDCPTSRLNKSLRQATPNLQATDADTRSATDQNLTESVRTFPPSTGSPATPPPQQRSADVGSGPTGWLRGTINSAIALVRNPASYIVANKDAPTTTNNIMLKYVAVLAAIPFFAILIGDLWYYTLFVPFGFAGSFFIGYAFTAAILTYVLDIVAVYVVSIVIRMLAPTFNSTVDAVKSLKLAAYIFTPAFLISVLDIIPILGILTILGVLYGLYILYIGLPIMLSTPKEKVVTYVVAVVVATIIVYAIFSFVIGAATSAIFIRSLGYVY